MIRKLILGALVCCLVISSSGDGWTSKAQALPMRELAQSGWYHIRVIVLEETSTNVYILSNKKNECIVIDPALQVVEIAATLKSGGLEPKAIFLTHNHWDHSAEINELAKLLDVPIITNVAQIKMGTASIGTKITTENIVKVADRQIVSFGNMEIEIMYSPGHSWGSMCFYHRDSGSLFSGDTIFRESIGRSDFRGSEGDKIIGSIMRVLEAIEFQTKIYPGHGKKTTKEHELAHNPFLGNDR